jgi:hypothetical protein
MNGGTVTALAVSPDFANDRTLLAGTSEGGVFKSTFAGIGGQGLWRYDDFQALFLPLILK